MLAASDGHVYVGNFETTRVISANGVVKCEPVNDVNHRATESAITCHSGMNSVLKADKESESLMVGVIKSESSPIRPEFPVKLCPATYATSILRGNSWTVQASSGQQQHSHSPQHLPVSRNRSNNVHTGGQLQRSETYKTGTQYGITASIVRPSIMGRANVEKRWVDEDITHYGAIEENCDNFDEWIDRVDVSKFAQDISEDLMSRPKLVMRKERNPPPTNCYPKPGWSYSNLIALALKNSETGQLTVAEIYAFMLEHFPYFRTAPSGWKNSVRHNLSLNKCFCKVEVDEDHQSIHQTRKSCLWMINPERLEKVEHDIRKWRERNPESVTEGMACPEDLQAIEEGTKGLPSYRTSKQVLRSVYLDNRSAQKEVMQYAPLGQRSENEDARAAEDLFRIVKEEVEANEMADNSALCTSNTKFVLSEDRNNSCAKVVAEFMPTFQANSMAETFGGASPKRSRNDSSCSPPREIPVLELLPSSFLDAFIPDVVTPPRPKRVNRDESLSPIRIESGFRHAHDALNDNSLLAAALEQSPYKMPVTFPVL